MLTRFARFEMGPRGIRVNAVSPGLVEDYVDNTALGRAGQPEEIAEAVVFLCSAT